MSNKYAPFLHQFDLVVSHINAVRHYTGSVISEQPESVIGNFVILFALITTPDIVDCDCICYVFKENKVLRAVNKLM